MGKKKTRNTNTFLDRQSSGAQMSYILTSFSKRRARMHTGKCRGPQGTLCLLDPLLLDTGKTFNEPQSCYKTENVLLVPSADRHEPDPWYQNPGCKNS